MYSLGDGEDKFRTVKQNYNVGHILKFLAVHDDMRLLQSSFIDIPGKGRLQQTIMSG